MFNISVDLEEVFDKDAPPSSWGKEGKLPHNRKRVMVCHGDGRFVKGWGNSSVGLNTFIR